MANNSYVVIFVYFAITGSMAIRCYDCGDRSLCDHPFSPSNSGVKITTCSGSCSKAQFGEFHERHCINGTQSSGCRDMTISGQTVDVCFCNTDLCNGAVIPGYLGTLKLAISVSVALMTLWRM